MNYRLISKLLSIILFALTGLFLSSLAVAVFYEPRAEICEKWILCATVAFILGAALYFQGSGASKKLFHRDALGLVSFSWILTILMGTLPYLFLLPELGFANALFESTSGFTSTGGTILTALEDLPRSLLYFRALTQWIGGLGIIIFFIAFLWALGPTSKILFSRESSQNRDELNVDRIQKVGLLLLILYSVLTMLCFGAYIWGGMGIFDAVCHSFTTISTGGMSTHSDSFMAFHSAKLEWICILFMILGGTNFLVIIQLFQRRWKNVFQNTEVRAYLLVLLFFSTVIALLLHYDQHLASFGESFRLSAFNTVSIITSTGFASSDFDRWIPITHVLLLVGMMIGGCSGSTAGGTKVIRIVTALKITRVSIEKAFRPRLVKPIVINGHGLSESHQSQIVNYIFMMAIVLIFLLPIYALLEPNLSFEGSISSYCTCLCNAGSAFAEFGPRGSFAAISAHSKWFLSFVMLLGRLEMYALLVLFIPAFWRKFN